jgi:hypothetical protein
VALAQWLELQRVLPSTISRLSGEGLDDDSANGPLHDALEELGSPALAEHFSTGCVHDKCWALQILAGVMPLTQLGQLTSKQAAAWLGISLNQFERIVKERGVLPASDKPAFRRGRIHHTCMWAPAVIAKLVDDPEVVAVRPV